MLAQWEKIFFLFPTWHNTIRKYHFMTRWQNKINCVTTKIILTSKMMDHTQFLYSINVIFLHRDKKNSSTTRKITFENVKAVALYRNYLLVNYEWHHYNKDKMLFFFVIFTVLCFYVIIIRSYIIILSILFFICHH
jgi:hypothetical protein